MNNVRQIMRDFDPYQEAQYDAFKKSTLPNHAVGEVGAGDLSFFHQQRMRKFKTWIYFYLLNALCFIFDFIRSQIAELVVGKVSKNMQIVLKAVGKMFVGQIVERSK